MPEERSCALTAWDAFESGEIDALAGKPPRPPGITQRANRRAYMRGYSYARKQAKKSGAASRA